MILSEAHPVDQLTCWNARRGETSRWGHLVKAEPSGSVIGGYPTTAAVS
jgi:hypothetical protein